MARCIKSHSVSCSSPDPTSLEQSPFSEVSSSAGSQEIPRVVQTTKFHCRVHKRTLFGRILSQSVVVHALATDFRKMHFKIILPAMCNRSMCSVPFLFPEKRCTHFYSTPYMPDAPPILSFIFDLTAYGAQYGSSYCSDCTSNIWHGHGFRSLL